MPLTALVRQLEQVPLTAEVLERIRRPDRLRLQGASRAARALTTSALACCEGAPLLVVVPTLEEAGRWAALLELMGWPTTQLYPTSEGSPYEGFDPTSEITWGQLQVLSELLAIDGAGKRSWRGAIVASERALQPHLPPPAVLAEQCLSLRKGDCVNLEQLGETLARLGYERVATIEQEGTWSRRGDIVDLFPVSAELPVRLEFFGDDLDKLREFDPGTQRSLDGVELVRLTPTSYGPLVAQALREQLPDGLEQLLQPEAMEQLLAGGTPEGMRRLMGLAWNEPSSLLDYLPEHTLVAVDERRQLLAHGQQWFNHVEQHYQDESAQLAASLLPNCLHKPIAAALAQLEAFAGFDLAELAETDNHPNSFELASRSVTAYPNQFGKLAGLIKGFQQDKARVWLLSAQPSRAVALLEEHNCISKFIPNPHDFPAIERLIEQNTPIALKTKANVELEGLQLPAWRLVLITDREFFGQHNLTASGYVRRRRRAASRTVDPNRMQPGDFVVHRNHGIGRFLKLEKLAIAGDARDYLVVQYADGLLRVAADQLGSLGRFRASTDAPPELNRMGGIAWARAKERARKAVRKVALDLVKLYAERLESPGFAFPVDGPWQLELEDSFPYEPTPDQVKAIADVKRDMEIAKPMDRLVCGDVGFGKTEVAIRAIFKAVTAGKQCALLAPTTVLAQQHWRTLSERYAPYPLKVALLNRFRTTAERKEILAGLQEGAIDIVVGTHQLLAKGTQFKQLGLLVVDEEQRFGVTQKEKIKVLRKDVDVLTLSATPIPRTLYMSLSGVREMSLITTPPPLRRPIKTHLACLDEEAVRSAIRQELDRGGQVFYVVPRVEGIEEVAGQLRQMLPGLRLLVAHGQMQEGELESAMVAFNAGEADLMLCTTIIESGLDIPRVNTILVEDAQKFGLAQLYQLRGRVGRSGIQAHAWLFYPGDASLTEAARQRLRAIQEFAQLGSGYQLAMRDMEIRGVGNLLGVEQSGQMETIGFDLYMEMLQEEMAEIRGQDIPAVDETQIDLTITAFIPADWITEADEKLAAYRAAADCISREALLQLASDWIDRYGALPAAVQSLLQVMELKLLAKRCGFARIKPEKPNIALETPMEEPAFRRLRQGLPTHLHGRLVYQAGSGSTAKVLARGLGVLPADKQLEELKNWLEMMAAQIPGN
ncbi:MAG: transcription-repair coupling factor [Synechococcaceae bacterium WBA_2_066]|nr:transcription-repair coupling factor [Synechococcaceae bacterium LLD_019]NCU75548.1 transcription-repair coupling factor [Synechococcaceae bacterium WB7_1C_051]NCU92115.1 transcription-repair coupling factor [Synechococcaceae bacterium WB7_1B_046]NCY13755.1 transcription-repair coupling factor [Synechococcaceae bacterium WB8_1A_041]NDC06724.1 transcription-repair coupling factor [Synechococcaceae bacterium WB9_2_069]NDE38335.1 transcription-repair coupling factor [Synechococcaceae bacterium